LPVEFASETSTPPSSLGFAFSNFILLCFIVPCKTSGRPGGTLAAVYDVYWINSSSPAPHSAAACNKLRYICSRRCGVYTYMPIYILLYTCACIYIVDNTCWYECLRNKLCFWRSRGRTLPSYTEFNGRRVVSTISRAGVTWFRKLG